METQRLRALKNPADIEELLASLIASLDFLPPSAHRLFLHDLPPALAVLAADADPSEGWCCWRAEERIWFYHGKISLPHSRERGKVVLQTALFDADANMVDSNWWIYSGSWRTFY